MVKVNRIPKPYLKGNETFQKELEKLVRDNVRGVQGGKTCIQASPINWRLEDGELIQFAGVNYLIGIGYSPLIAEGSGQGIAHPETIRILTTITTERVNIPVPAKVSERMLVQEYIAKKVRTVEVDSFVTIGSTLVAMYSAQNKEQVLLQWTSVLPAIVRDIEYIYSEVTNSLDVKVTLEQLRKSDAEKARGVEKYRSDGGFNRSISIYESESKELIFNPNHPLKDSEGNYQQLERVISPEESKTILALIGLVAHELGGVTWDSLTGQWENLDLITSKLEEMMLRVDIKRSDVDPYIYQGFRNLYFDDEDFIFNDDKRSIIHKNVPFWQGVQTEIIETPTTLAFAGRTSLFLEHDLYLGSEFPKLSQKLFNSIQSNSEDVRELYKSMTFFYNALTSFNLWEQRITEVDPNAVLELPQEFYDLQKKSLIISESSLITWQKDLDKDRVLIVIPETAEGVSSNDLDSLILPDSLDWDSAISIVQQKLLKIGITGLLFFSFTKGQSLLYIPLQSFLKYTRTGSGLTYRDFISILVLLETPFDQRDDGWYSNFYRFIQIVKGRLEALLAESNTMAAKMSKTERICLSARIGNTNWGIIKPNEVHLHPASIGYYGLRPHYSVHLNPIQYLSDEEKVKGVDVDNITYHWKVNEHLLQDHPDLFEKGMVTVGDYIVLGRVPVPGMTLLKVVSNELVPFGTVFTLSSTQQFANEGDADGDQATCIVIRDDDLFECKGLNINPLQDNTLS